MKKTNKMIALVLAVITLLSVVCVVPVTASAKVTNVVSSSAKSPTSGKWGRMQSGNLIQRVCLLSQVRVL